MVIDLWISITKPLFSVADGKFGDPAECVFFVSFSTANCIVSDELIVLTFGSSEMLRKPISTGRSGG